MAQKSNFYYYDSHLLLSFCVFLSLVILKSTTVLDESILDKFAANNIMFYNPDDCSTSGRLECTGNLPAETVTALEQAGVKEKAEQNKERYEYAEKETGIPWQVLAALHYREGVQEGDYYYTIIEKYDNEPQKDETGTLPYRVIMKKRERWLADCRRPRYPPNET